MVSLVSMTKYRKSECAGKTPPLFCHSSFKQLSHSGIDNPPLVDLKYAAWPEVRGISPAMIAISATSGSVVLQRPTNYIASSPGALELGPPVTRNEGVRVAILPHGTDATRPRGSSKRRAVYAKQRSPNCSPRICGLVNTPVNNDS